MQQTKYLVKMNKKAMSETLVILLVFILVAILLISFGGKLVDLFKEDADIEACRLSVLAQSQTKTLGKSVVSLDCPRRIMKIYEDKVEIKTKDEIKGKESKKYKFNKLTADEVNHIIAEELRLCWYKMAEGNRNVFEQSYIFGGKSICLICAEIEFDEKLKEKSFEGLADYLKSNKIPKVDMSYSDYLIRSQKDQYFLGGFPWTQYLPWGLGEGITSKIDEQKLNADQKYLIYFLAFKPNWLNEKLRAFESAYYIGLGKEDKLPTQCALSIN